MLSLQENNLDYTKLNLNLKRKSNGLEEFQKLEFKKKK